MTSQGTRPYVLVVEDEPDFAALMESMILRLGYDAGVAHGAEEALASVRARRPDAITLDIKMPGKSGALFYRQMKSDPALRDVPVVVVTGLIRDNPDWGVLVHAFLETDRLPPPWVYLEKPVDLDALAKALGPILGAPKGA